MFVVMLFTVAKVRSNPSVHQQTKWMNNWINNRQYGYNEVYPYNRIEFTHEKECSPDTQHNIGSLETQSQVERHKRQTLCDSTPMKYLDQANLQRQEVDESSPGAGGGEVQGFCSR